VCAICLSWNLCAQSITISKTENHNDSSRVVNTYRRNANAVLDSLIRYEFLKLRSVDIRSNLENCEKKYAGQSVELLKSRQSESSARIGLETERTRRYRAGLENWVWRGLALLSLLKLAHVW
jgi:hypothetical protein